MGDLEDAFLRKNVPGRYSSWADEDDDERHNDDVDVDRGGGGGVAVGAGEDEDEDDEYYLRDLPPPPPPHHRHHRAPSSSSSSSSSGGGGTRSNTGVKGVLADYRAAAEDERKGAEAAREEASWARATRPATRRSGCRAAPPDGKRGWCGMGDHRDGGRDDDDDGGGSSSSSSSSEDDDDADDDDDRCSGSIRRRRPARPRGSAARSGPTAVGGVFGQPKARASPEEYVRLVDETGDDPDGPFLVVHLSSGGGGGASTETTRCRMLRSALEELASSSHCHHSAGANEEGGVGVKFIEVDALEANPNLDAICLPAILIYRHGELVHNLVRFDDDLPRDFGAGDVRAIFEGLGVLGPTAIARRRGCF